MSISQERVQYKVYLGKRSEQALYRWPKARVHIIVHFSACLWRRTWYKSKLAYRVGLQGSSLQTISYLFVPVSSCIYSIYLPAIISQTSSVLADMYRTKSVLIFRHLPENQEQNFNSIHIFSKFSDKKWLKNFVQGFR